VNIVEKYLQTMTARDELRVNIDHDEMMVTFKKPVQKMEENSNSIRKFCEILKGINIRYEE